MSLFFWPVSQVFGGRKMLWRTTLEQTETESATPDDSGFVPYDMWFQVWAEAPNRESGQELESFCAGTADLARNAVND
jgi:hypothetical protein